MIQKDNRKTMVFLGTPQVAANVLNEIAFRAQHLIKIILVVTQPPSRSSRSHHKISTPVHEQALKLGIPVLTPENAKDLDFLKDLEILAPDLCLTAAYGNYLPKAFLNIPKFGTLNIHPSLLPLYRGAAPVQRAVENGDKVSGVSLLVTVSKMDAGPLVAQQSYNVPQNMNSDELLEVLFKIGSNLFIKNIQAYFQNEITIQDQIHEFATHANKIEKHESILDIKLSAFELHNKVRAFSGWPGTKLFIQVDSQELEIKIIETEITENNLSLKNFELVYNHDAFYYCCHDNNLLKIKKVQPFGKKVLTAKDFHNGLKTKQIKIINKLPL